jgi:predicted DNA-binding transcriptional regulator AlpA
MTHPPELLNIKQACALLGISERSFHLARKQPWFPSGIQLGARVIRFSRAELVAAAERLAPRAVGTSEPAQLAEARASRAASRVSSASGSLKSRPAR